MRNHPALALMMVTLAVAPLQAQQHAGYHAAHGGGPATSPTLAAAAAIGPVRVDGVLDEGSWASAEVAGGFTQQSPRPGAPAAYATEVRVLVDEAAVYVGVRAFDPAPDSIVARLARRDADVLSDWIHVALDSYGDRRSAYQFGVNAAGVKRDVRITEDTREDATWDGVWDGAARIDADGWTVEIRIPLVQLRYGTDAAAAWRFNVKRVVARAAEVSFWAPVPVSAGSYVSSFGELSGVRPARAARGAEVQPYFATRVQHDAAMDADPLSAATRLSLNGGLDLTWRPAPTWRLGATVNPDFGQVEADPSHVNLTAYEQFLPERRPFFVEGAEYFRTRGPTLFYSRRIGRAPQGRVRGAEAVAMPEQATLLGAVKVTGQSGGWSLGVLDAVTSREHARYLRAGAEHRALVEPATNHFVARVVRDAHEGRTGIGAIVTATHRFVAADEMPELRRTAWAGGLDARHRFGGGRYEASGAAFGSHVAGDTAAIAATQRAAGHYFQRPDAEHLRYDATRRALAGAALHGRIARVGGGPWRAHIGAEYTSPGFEVNDLGYSNDADRVRMDAMLRYLRNEPGRWLRRWSLSTWAQADLTTGGERIEVTATYDFTATLNNHWGFSLWAMRHGDGFRPDALRGGPALYHPGRWMASADINTDPRRALSASAGVFGDRLDQQAGSRLNLYGSLQVRPSTRLDLALQPSVGHYRFAMQYVGRQPLAGQNAWLLGSIRQHTASASVRLNYTFNPALSLQFYAQPYRSNGDFSEYKLVSATPRAQNPRDRFDLLAADRIRSSSDEHGTLHYTFDRDDSAVLRWTDPSYDFAQVRTSAVLRWEFRPASTLFLVWTRERTDQAHGVTGPDAVMVKLSYWLGR